MKISFNLISCGLNNNGGSQTLIKSANTLQELGNEVTIVDSGKNLNTWNPIKCNHLIIKDLKDFPTGDAVIATGYKTVNSTLKLKDSCGKKFHWIRGFETWVYDEKYIFEKILNNNLVKIVNSICLQRKLQSYGISSEIIRPGHTFEDFNPLNIRQNNKRIVLGGLYNSGAKRSKKRTEWIFDCYNILKKKYDIDILMFGTDGIPSNIPSGCYLKNPPIKTKNYFYNTIDIWLATSELEGLHIAPQEAMLTECCVVGNNSEMSGTEDYLNNLTGLVSENNFKSFVYTVEYAIQNKDLVKKVSKEGRQKIIDLGNRQENMLKFITLLKEG